MRKNFWIIPVLGVLLSGCVVQQTMRAMECNRQAIDRSTWAICDNVQAVEEANQAIQENRKLLESINKTLKKASES